MIELIGVIIFLLLVNVVLIYRNRAQKARHAAEIQKTINEALNSAAVQRRRLDDDLAIVEEKQRVETIAQQSHLAERRDFDSDWDGLPKHASGDGAADRSATAADPASFADD